MEVVLQGCWCVLRSDIFCTSKKVRDVEQYVQLESNSG